MGRRRNLLRNGHLRLHVLSLLTEAQKLEESLKQNRGKKPKLARVSGKLAGICDDLKESFPALIKELRAKAEEARKQTE